LDKKEKGKCHLLHDRVNSLMHIVFCFFNNKLDVLPHPDFSEKQAQQH